MVGVDERNELKGHEECEQHLDQFEAAFLGKEVSLYVEPFALEEYLGQPLIRAELLQEYWQLLADAPSTLL